MQPEPSILQDINLLKKYDIQVFDYIEYPHKSFWQYGLTDHDFRRALSSIFKDDPIRGITVYLHIPFCEQLCYFCLCHRQITSHYQPIQNYLDRALLPEIDLFGTFFEEHGLRPNVKQIFMGGGSPTIVNQADFDRILAQLGRWIDLAQLDHFYFEIDPRRVTPDQLRFYHSRGVTTLSFGIQDFDPAVQEAINRVQPYEMVANLLSDDIHALFDSINFDLQ
ncbi:MAG: radical SAM protein, partial [Magnetococcales bacterium]|nr:radical SAM protein [Magnetococcales bacterium]